MRLTEKQKMQKEFDKLGRKTTHGGILDIGELSPEECKRFFELGEILNQPEPEREA